MRQSDGQTWNHGDSAADVGSVAWAEYVRLQLVAQVEHLGEDEESFVGFLEIFREHRAWTLLVKKDGAAFQTIDEFCAYPRPWGLGTSWATLKPHLVSGLAKQGLSQDEIDRRLALEMVAEAKDPVPPPPGPGRGKKKALGSERPSLSEPGSRKTKTLRAINRAPDAVKEAYREGRISQTLAAKLGPKDPDGETAARNAEIARELRAMKDRKAADDLVRQRLGVVKVGPVDRALGIVRNMTDEELLEFEARFSRYLEQNGLLARPPIASPRVDGEKSEPEGDGEVELVQGTEAPLGEAVSSDIEQDTSSST